MNARFHPSKQCAKAQITLFLPRDRGRCLPAQSLTAASARTPRSAGATSLWTPSLAPPWCVLGKKGRTRPPAQHSIRPLPSAPRMIAVRLEESGGLASWVIPNVESPWLLRFSGRKRFPSSSLSPWINPDALRHPPVVIAFCGPSPAPRLFPQTLVPHEGRLPHPEQASALLGWPVQSKFALLHLDCPARLRDRGEQSTP